MMKRYLSVPVLSLATALLAASQFGCANSQNTNTSTNANMAMAQATPDKAAIETEIARIEKDWPRIIKEHDAATVRRIEADDAILIYPDGTIGGKEQDVKDIESGALTADSWEVSEIKVNVLDNDSAVASGRNTVKGGKYKMPDGKIQNISGDYRWLDTYVRRNGQWQMVAGASIPTAKSAAPSPKASPATSPAIKASPAMKATPAAKASPAAKGSPAMKPPSPTPAKAKTP